MTTGRPPLAPGERGRVTTKQLGPNKFQARVVLRELDGRRRDLTVTAKSREAAQRLMEARLKERTAPSIMGITATMTVDELCDYWLSHRLKQTFTAPPVPTQRSGRRAKARVLTLKPQTVASYAAAVNSTIKPTLGALRLQELTVGRLDQVLTDLEHTGVSTAQMRSVLSQMLRVAARHGAITGNPMTLVEPPPREDREVEVLESDGVALLRHLVRPEVQGTPGRRRPNRDLCEYVDVALGTGARISEVLALRWEHVDLDAELPTVLVNGTLVEPRKGYVDTLHRQEHTKTGDTRVLLLPDHVVALLRARRARVKHTDASDPVFASTNGTWLWPNNLRTRLRAAIVDTELEGTTPHTLRRTVGTSVAHQVSLDAARAQLGHALPGITGRLYVAPRKLGPDVRHILGSYFGSTGVDADS